MVGDSEARVGLAARGRVWCSSGVERGGGRVAALALAVFGFSACASAATSRTDVLDGLRRDLAQARSTPKDVHYDKRDPSDVSALRGMTAREIRLALGEPSCPTKDVLECDDGAALQYSFYHLPEGDDGGGLELLVFTDSDSRCREARWIQSE
jgi:hypothetical protein